MLPRWFSPPLRRLALRFGLGLGSVGALVLLAVCADALLAGPMRTRAERMMNASLNGYEVHIGRARPRLWKLAFALDEVVLVQKSHPAPPVAEFGALEFTLQWWELARFKVAGDLTLRRPALHINLAQISEEAASKVSLKDRGWQQAVESIYPFRLNQVRVIDGSLLYLDHATEANPLQLTRVAMVARNVRNIDAAGGAFPSPVTFEGHLFDTGTVSFQGAADFLRKPDGAAQGTLHLVRVPLDRFKPLARDYQLATTGSYLSATGTLDYAPEARKAHLTEVLLEGLRVDYLTSRSTQRIEAQHAQEAVKLARRVKNAPGLVLQIDSLKLTHGQVGFVDASSRPPFRLFVSDLDLNLTNLSNQAEQGRSKFQARGSFMGHGVARISGGGRLTELPSDFDVHLHLENARLHDLDGLLLAHTGLTIARGRYALFSEITVKKGRLEGYLKPILTNVKVYDRRTDRDKPFVKRMEMHLAQGLAYLFKNRSTQDIATVTRLSGRVDAPNASEWQTVRQLLGNGFVRAILPGFLNQPKTKDTNTGKGTDHARNEPSRKAGGSNHVEKPEGS